MDKLKLGLADAVFQHLEEDARRSIVRCEVQRVSNLVIQFKVWPDGEAPRYFNVKVSEML